MNANLMLKNAYKIITLIVLVVLLLGVLTFTGIMKPRVIPGWCNVYWGAMGFATGGPKVAIVYGTDGLGNPDGPCPQGLQQCSLKEILANPQILGVRADLLRLSSVNLGNLKNYNLVIVEKARTMETKQMRALIDYYNQGGRLVWTGDAGTMLGPNDEYLYTNERANTDSNKIIGPWARKDNDIMVSLDQVLSVEYKTNFCSIKSCPENSPIPAGRMMPETTGENPFIKGMGASLPLYVFKGEDFSIVETISGGVTTQALSLEPGTSIVGTDGKDYGSEFPLIVSSGLGDRAVYYAVPPEYFANPKLYNFSIAGKAGYVAGVPGPYFLPIENLYWGMICG
ncbi:MAG TPA: hypothetical protein VI977_04410 [archaeon]|nr:hypothetical protein [archaeon]